MGAIIRILPVFIGWIVWRKTGNIIIGALVAVVIEGFIGAIFSGGSGSSTGTAEGGADGADSAGGAAGGSTSEGDGGDGGGE